MIAKQYETVGFNVANNENQLTTYHRVNVLNWACKLNHGDCVSKSRALFDAFKSETQE